MGLSLSETLSLSLSVSLCILSLSPLSVSLSLSPLSLSLWQQPPRYRHSYIREGQRERYTESEREKERVITPLLGYSEGQKPPRGIWKILFELVGKCVFGPKITQPDTQNQ